MTTEDASTTIVIDFPVGDLLCLQKLFLHLKHRNRYILDGVLDKFVSAILAFARKHATTRIPNATRFYRARLHPDQSTGDSSPLSKDEMTAPPASKCTAGRLNPGGIPYLYLASDEPTAVAEVRPWVGAHLTMAPIELEQDIKVVDTTGRTTNGYDYSCSENPPPPGAGFAWREIISYSFSIPYCPTESINYIPTQYLAETFKASGFDGALYNSSLNPSGHNLALFDPQMGKVLSTHAVNVKRVAYEYRMSK